MSKRTASLWANEREASWQEALAAYDDVIAAQGVASLAAHDAWYQAELPASLRSREPSFATYAELVRITEWKMARGVWRARNLVLVRGNDPDDVARTTRAAFAEVPHESAPIATIAKLAGVGPATASAVMSAFEPSVYPFLDELVAAQVPELGKPAFTPTYYRKYAAALRDRATQLGGHWTPSAVERALWAHVGGKLGLQD